jgi:hypothetical protein
VDHQKEELVILLLQTHLKVIQVDLEHPQELLVVVEVLRQLEETQVIIMVEMEVQEPQIQF